MRERFSRKRLKRGRSGFQFFGWLHEMRHDMSLKVVDIYQRYGLRQRQSLGKRRTYQQRTEQSRSARKSNGGQVRSRHSGTPQSRIHHRHNILLMGAAGQLRHDAAIFLMHFLTRNHVATQHSVHDHSRGGVVTTGLYRQNNCFFHNRLQNYSFFWTYANFYISLQPKCSIR